MRHIADLLAFLALVAGALLFGFIISRQPTGLPLYFVIGVLVVSLSFMDMRLALGFLALSMLLSPEIAIAAVPRRDVVVRFDDLLLGVIFLSWLAKQAIDKKLPLIKASPVNRYILYYLAACFLFTGKGIVMGHTDHRQAVFYLLKYIEYFIIFWMTYNVINKKEDIKILINFFMICAVIVLIHSYFIFPGRVHAPFDPGEPASIGGYFVILSGISLGMLIFHSSAIAKAFFAALLILIVPLVIVGESRATYAALPVMFLTVIAVTSKYRKRLLLSGLAGVFLIPFVLGSDMYSILMERVLYTFSGGYGGMNLDPSSAARVISWQIQLFRYWPLRPFTGWGVTGRGFIDSQYVRTLVELGIIGFYAFLLLKYKILKLSVAIFRTLDDGWHKGLVLGFIGAAAGLLVHAVTTNTFIIVRIMGPFWFIFAIVMAIPKVSGPVMDVKKEDT